MAAHLLPAYDTDPQRWRAVTDRDHHADGVFVYAVVTTGIFCRPGCSARQPRRENVRFFDSVVEARAAGFRACLRCRPEEAPDAGDAVLLARACALIDDAEETLSRARLAAALGVSESRLSRLFRARLGITPADDGLWDVAGEAAAGTIDRLVAVAHGGTNSAIIATLPRTSTRS